MVRVRDTTASAPPPEFSTTSSTLLEFTPVTLDSLRTLLQSTSNASCGLDPIPTFIVREFSEDLLPFLLILCNRSILEGILPPTQKGALIRPSLKKADLDPEDISNY